MKPESIVAECISVLGEPNRSGRQFVWCCPFCEDRGKPSPDAKYHLYVNPYKREHRRRNDGKLLQSPSGWAFCQRCLFASSTAKMLSRLGVYVHEGASVQEWDQILSRIHALGTDSAQEFDPNEPLQEIEYPCRTHSMERGLKSFRYLRGRGFTLQQMRLYGARFGGGGNRWANRIFLPIHDDEDRLVFWVARWFGPKHDPEADLKYRNPYGVPRKWFLYNHWPVVARLAAHEADTIDIVEGALSAWAAGLDAVATLGVYVTPEQQQLLVRMPTEAERDPRGVSYRIIPDGDEVARRHALRLARALHRRGRRVLLADLPDGQDPNSIPPAEYQALAKQAVPYAGLRTEIRMRLR